MMKSSIKVMLLSVILCPLLCSAQIRYSAPLDGSAHKLWSNKDSKISCELNYDVPGFGYAQFTTYAGRELKTSLQIVPKLGINDRSEMRFIATKPEWQSGGKETLLGRVDIYNGFNAFTGPTLAWRILTYLSNGNQILMPYTDNKMASGQSIIPAISPMGFKKPYESYLTCQHNLLRVNFNDIQMLPLAFNLKTDVLTIKSKARIEEQLAYIKEDKSIIGITIRAFAYDMEHKQENIKMASDRAEALKKYYTDAGFADDIIKIVEINTLTIPNDGDNVTVNDSITARNALVTLTRDESMINKDLEIKVPDVGATTGER